MNADLLRRLLDLARDALVVLDADGRIATWSAGAHRIFGFVPEQAVGHTFGALMGPDAVLPEAAQAELHAIGEWSGHLECLTARGEVVVVEHRCRLVRGASGAPAAILTSSVDITERRRAEKEIVLLNNVLERRIQSRTAELEESNEDLRDFAHSLAHDLRAPLSSIDGFSAQLERRLGGRLDAKEAHYLRRVRAGVRLMTDLTDGLLGLADRSHAPLLPQPVNLSALARAVAERLCEQEPQRDVEIVIEDTPPAQGDARLLADVLENLVGNAWKFTSRTARARIVFGAEPEPGASCRYFVRDNGAGFDPAYAYKLFGPFQRLHAAGEFEGNGIGLAIVRKIIARHGGRIWGESRPGEGATFFFTLNDQPGTRQPRAARLPGETTSPAPLTGA